MLLKGDLSFNDVKYRVAFWENGKDIELSLIVDGIIQSSYKLADSKEYMYGDNKAREIYRVIKSADAGIGTCKKSNIGAAPFLDRGVQKVYTFKKKNVDHVICKFNKSITAISIMGESFNLEVEYGGEVNVIPTALNYTLIKVIKDFEFDANSGEVAPEVKSLAEIGMEKEGGIEWLKQKKYYIVDTPALAEKIFTFLHNYKGPVAYDTETTGLKINMFGKYGGEYTKLLEEYNNEKPEEDKIRADKLVGIILCWKPHESYYFPVGHRFIQNLYDGEQKNSSITLSIIEQMKMWADEHREKDFSNYVRNCKELSDFTPDAILMHRCRHLLENCHIVAHNGTFEWKVSYLYDIIINLKDDTMIMHQLMYKFRSGVGSGGESSSLKFLTRKEFSVNTLDLVDFFSEYKEGGAEVRAKKTDKKGKGKKKKSKIDFSYMDYDGTRAYAPADGDFTLQLFLKYKRDLLDNHEELDYLYNVEITVASAIAYMEFSGHRIDEDKIESTRMEQVIKTAELEYEIRELAKLNTPKDAEAYKKSSEVISVYKDAAKDKTKDKAEISKLRMDALKAAEELKKAMEESENVLNLGSPKQLCELFYDRMKIPFKGEKQSVDKKTLKAYTSMKDESGNPKHLIMVKYRDWKDTDTLITKFFDNLQYFMYPGGFIFSSYGQISTATGRMSCKGPNAQQYPKAITAIVVPRKDCVFCDADYSQIEYRVLVGMAKEEYFLEKFKDPDTDYHTLQASNMYGVDYAAVTKEMRGDAKSFNFGIPYGMGFGSLAILLYGRADDFTIEEAKRKYELYFKDQPKVRQFFQDIKETALLKGYTKTYFDRRRYYKFTDKNGNTDNRAKAQALRQAGNAVIQGTAADIFKIAVARLYRYIKKYDLFGKFYISNMIHDECLMEIDVTKLNAKAMIRDITDRMQFGIEGYPPLFIGAGFGMSWKEAKGPHAEIHPDLNKQIALEVKNTSIFDVEFDTPAKVIDEFERINYNFRRDKIANYLMDDKNLGKLVHPTIGSLINGHFTFGIIETEENKDTILLERITRFGEEFNLDVRGSDFVSHLVEQEEEEDKSYDDDEDDLEDIEINEYSFALVDESDVVFGVGVEEVIAQFGLLVSPHLKILGIDARQLKYGVMEKISQYIESIQVDGEQIDRDEVLQVVLLGTGNKLQYLPVFVQNVNGSEITKIIKLNERALTLSNNKE